MSLRSHQKGFTLLEILIAAGITGIIIMVMTSVYINATKLWLSTDVHMKAQQMAREVLSGSPQLKVRKGTGTVEWQGILNELQEMCILLPAYPGGTSTLSPNKIRFATEAYIQDGGNNICNSGPASIFYSGNNIADVQIGTTTTTATGVRRIWIIHGEDGKFRSVPGDRDGDRSNVESTDDVLYGRIIIGPDGTITTGERTGFDDVLTGNTAAGSILINPGTDNSLQSILGDKNGDGDILDGGDQQDPDEYVVGDVISYEFNPGTRTITRILNDNSTTGKSIGTDIAGFSLSYYNANNQPATTTTNVKQISGTLTVSLPKKAGAKYATYTITFKAAPRKLNSAFGGGK